MTQLKFYGIGGQGAVTAAKILATAVSLYEDRYAITIPAYGHERRGAPVSADVIISGEVITLNCYVYEPDIVVVLDETSIEKNVNVGSGIHPDSTLVLNASGAEAAERYRSLYGFKRVIYTDATKIAVANIGRSIPNGAILGCLAKTGVVAIDSVERALRDYFGQKAGEKNAKAARAAYEASQEA